MMLYRAGRACSENSVFRISINELFEVKIPVMTILNFIQKQKCRPPGRMNILVEKLENLGKRYEFQNRVIKANIKDTFRVLVSVEKPAGDLQEYRRLSDTARTA